MSVSDPTLQRYVGKSYSNNWPHPHFTKYKEENLWDINVFRMIAFTLVCSCPNLRNNFFICNIPVAHGWIPGNIRPASFWKKSRNQYFPRLHRVTRGANALGASMQCLWGCGSRLCISLVLFHSNVSVQNHVSGSKNFNVRTLAPTANGTDSLRGQVSWSTPPPPHPPLNIGCGSLPHKLETKSTSHLKIRMAISLCNLKQNGIRYQMLKLSTTTFNLKIKLVTTSVPAEKYITLIRNPIGPAC